MPALYATGRAARRAVLFALAAFALHQLRYLIGYGEEAGESLAEHGHAYLELTLPFLAAVAVSVLPVTLVLALLTPRAASSSPAEDRAVRAGFKVRVATYAALLLATFVFQEVAEGLLSPGHPAGIAGIFAHGGWIVAPLAVSVGIVLTLVLDALSAIERHLTGGSLLLPVRRHPVNDTDSTGRPPTEPRAALALAFGLARRPPPPLLVQ